MLSCARCLPLFLQSPEAALGLAGERACGLGQRTQSNAKVAPPPQPRVHSGAVLCCGGGDGEVGQSRPGRPVCRPVDHDSAEYKSDQSILRKTCPHSQSVPPSSSLHSSRRPRVFFWQRRRKRRFLFRILSIRVLELGELYSKRREVARSRTFVLCGPGAHPNQIQLAYAFYTH